MNSFSYAGLALIISTVACVDAGVLSNHVSNLHISMQENSASGAFGSFLVGRALQEWGYKKVGNRLEEAGIVGTVYGLGGGSQRGTLTAAGVDAALREMLAQLGNTDKGQQIAANLPDWMRAELSQQIACAIVAMGTACVVEKNLSGKKEIKL